jgi:hypothetical protein
VASVDAVFPTGTHVMLITLQIAGQELLKFDIDSIRDAD